MRGARGPTLHERGASVVETVLVLPLLIGVLMATVAFGLGAVAKAVVTDAARTSGRLAAIECGQGDANWYADAQAAAAAALSRGLRVGALTTAPAAYGDWAFQASCATPGVPGAAVTVLVTYDEVDLFPPMASLISPGAPGGSRVFQLEAGAVFPEE
jgi:Flp pilus assembly protein TadG